MSADEITQVQFSIPYFTNLPEDVVTNTFHFIYEDGIGGLPVNANYVVLGNAIKAFYTSVYAALAMGSWLNKSLCSMKMYDLTQPTPRVPKYMTLAPLTTTQVGGSTPTEVAICLSMAGDTIPGINPARQRGRIFLGGFATPCAVGSVSSFPTIQASARTALGAAAVALKTAAVTGNWTWIVYSPTNGAAGGQESFDVTHGWVDDTPDTQRRRGVTTQVRTAW